ncbi:MAG: DUF488 domain-containing protein [Acidobacteria bacterium]|jgi:uncharacterized protein (DUF488 family)|nr:DUF488 domain-containing protein [Acidobacteriota bacterium]
MRNNTLFTIGHSNRSINEFVELLRAHGIEQLIDVRTIPRSRHNPQFNKKELATFLRNRKINYSHIKELGGLRQAKKDSPNTAWKNASFRGFADYMLTSSFAGALNKLMAKAEKKRTAIMCAEAVPWRCHRSLISDALVTQKWQVFHIQTRKTARKHELTSFLKIQDNQIVYPGFPT